jgi:O-methyltransferase
MLHVTRYNPYAEAPIRPWEGDASLATPVPCAVGLRGRYAILQWLHQASHLDGDVMELGVFKGGTAYMLGRKLKSSGKTLHLFDTFEGMPEVNRDYDNYWRKGDFNETSLNSVRELLSGFDVEIHPGLFQDTAPKLADRTFCFAHIDADIYDSVWCTTDFLYTRMPSGGIILYDDYGWQDCAGAKIAVDKFFHDRPEKPILVGGHQAVVIKR